MTRKSLLSAILVATLSTGLIAANSMPAFAGTTGDTTTAKASANGADSKAAKELVKVSDDALMSMRNVNDARVALFNGDQAAARTLVDAAVTRIGSAVQNANKYAVDVKAAKSDDQFVPVDSYISVLDSFKEVKPKAQHLAKANQHLHRGQPQKALETLKQGDIDVAITTQLIPVKFAQDHIKLASKLMEQGKYYQANLALKAVDDSAIMQTLAVDSTPKT